MTNTRPSRGSWGVEMRGWRGMGSVKGGRRKEARRSRNQVSNTQLPPPNTNTHSQSPGYLRGIREEG